MFEIQLRRALWLPVVAIAALSGASVWAQEQDAAGQAQGEPQEEQTPVEQYMRTMDLVDSLQVYNVQLEQLLADQQEDIRTINDSLERFNTVRRQIVPLTQRMILSLERFIELDLPFRLEERRARVAELKDLMDRVDVSDAEKFRMVLDAYETEIEYGASREAYADFIEIEGQRRQVDVLRMGRTLLAFQTVDGKVTGIWDDASGEWELLDERYAQGVRNGLRMARETMTDDVVILPVPAPERGQ